MDNNNIMTGNGLRVCYNDDTGNQLAQTNNNIEINQINTFPVLKIESEVQGIDTFNSSHQEKLLGSQDVNEITISVNYVPDDESHQYLDEKLETQDEFQLVLIYDQDDENITYSIVNGVLSGSQISGDKDAVVQKSFNFIPTQMIISAAVTKVQDNLVRGDYGVGSNGITVPHYQPDVPAGNSFIKVPSVYSPSGTDTLGIGLVDNGQYSSFVMTKSGTLQLYARNTDSAWSRIFTAQESDNKYVPKTTTVNGKVLTGNITLNSGDVGSYSKTETDTQYVSKRTTVNGKNLSADIVLSPSDIGTMSSTEISSSFVQKTTTINNKPLSTDIVLNSNDVGLGNVQNVSSFSKVESDRLYVKKTQTVNGKTLQENITLTPSDIGLGNVQNVSSYSKAETDAKYVSKTTTVNGKDLSTDIILNYNDVGSYSKTETDTKYVSKTTTVNGKPLSTNIVLNAGDVGLGNVQNVSSYSKTETDTKYVPKTTMINNKPLTGSISLNSTDVGLGNVQNVSSYSKAETDSIFFHTTGGTVNGRVDATGDTTAANIYSRGIINAVSAIEGQNIVSKQHMYLRNSGTRIISFETNEGLQDGYISKTMDSSLVINVRNKTNGVNASYSFQADGNFLSAGGVYGTYIKSSGTVDCKDLVSNSNIYIRGDGRRHFQFQNASGSYTDGYIFKDLNGAMVIQPNGQPFQFGTDGNAYVPGLVYAAGFQNTSDKRIKKNIQLIENALDKIEKINGVTYDKESNLYRGEGDKPTYESEAGFIAQEIQQVLPEAVGEFKLLNSDQKLLSLKLGQIDALILQGVKELAAKVKVLEDTISKMQKNTGDNGTVQPELTDDKDNVVLEPTESTEPTESEKR